ncbi:SMODS domain-containing nucleotidyltransferase [Rhodococcus qingshengii]|uniref:SMODS domain-containing nucleotidyltransferase n=1 Tax=Rhodococcus qingshengii TaxID=334542 RepID=UPI001C8CEA52|nr:nucleotidyltransferase [Rhodococcus qingshengii]MBX9147971.1 nucleotidyltransferase [Rhodococcus qingshengii]
MSTGTRFDKFLANISLTQAEKDEAISRSTSVAMKLHQHYYPSRTYNGDTKLLIGSHGKRTRVRPVRDVDLIFRIPPETFVRFSGHTGNGQSALLQEIRGLLRERYPSTNVKGDGPIVLVPFTSGHTVEVVPAWHETSKDNYWIPNTHDGGSWVKSSYSSEFDYLDASDRASGGQTRRLIKMMKVWQQHCNVPIKSLCIELRAINFLATWEHRNKSSTYDDWMIRDFLVGLIKMQDGWCKIPGIDESCKYGNAWLYKAETALSDATEACAYEADEAKAALAAYTWRKIFGSQYAF